MSAFPTRCGHLPGTAPLVAAPGVLGAHVHQVSRRDTAELQVPPGQQKPLRWRLYLHQGGERNRGRGNYNCWHLIFPQLWRKEDTRQEKTPFSATSEGGREDRQITKSFILVDTKAASSIQSEEQTWGENHSEAKRKPPPKAPASFAGPRSLDLSPAQLH